MATRRETVDFILDRLKSPRFVAKAMFGEYALYADGKVVALICDDRLYVKDTPVTASLAECEKGPPYPGAKPHYIVDEGQLAAMAALPQMLLGLAASLPSPKAKAKAKPKKAKPASRAKAKSKPKSRPKSRPKAKSR